MSIYCSKQYTIGVSSTPPLAYYKLDSGTGSVLHDESTNLYDLAIYYGTATFSAGKISNAATGAFNARKTASTLNLTGGGASFTVRFWMRLNAGISNASSTALLLYGNTTGLQVSVSGVEGASKTISFNLYNGGAVVATVDVDYDALGYGVWHHFVCVYTAGVGLKVRINDAAEQTDAYAAAMAAMSSTTIEIDNNLTKPTFQLIDEVGIWPEAWSAARITADYNSGSGETYP